VSENDDSGFSSVGPVTAGKSVSVSKRPSKKGKRTSVLSYLIEAEDLKENERRVDDLSEKGNLSSDKNELQELRPAFQDDFEDDAFQKRDDFDISNDFLSDDMINDDDDDSDNSGDNNNDDSTDETTGDSGGGDTQYRDKKKEIDNLLKSPLKNKNVIPSNFPSINEDEDDDEDDEDDTSQYRDKKKEIRDNAKLGLSSETLSMIDDNEGSLEEIIEKLQKRGISKEMALRMAKLKGIGSRGSGGMSL
jgi:hypothetical protein